MKKARKAKKSLSPNRNFNPGPPQYKEGIADPSAVTFTERQKLAMKVLHSSCQLFAFGKHILQLWK
jgi:hypothetical protein